MPALFPETGHLLLSAVIASLKCFVMKEVKKMRYSILTKTLMAAVLLILAIPLGASAQVYNRDRYYNGDNRDQYDRMNQRDARVAINRLENSTARLESDLNFTTSRRVLGIFL